MKAVGVHSQSLAPLAALVMAILTKYHCQFLRRWPATGGGQTACSDRLQMFWRRPCFQPPDGAQEWRGWGERRVLVW